MNRKDWIELGARIAPIWAAHRKATFDNQTYGYEKTPVSEWGCAEALDRIARIAHTLHRLYETACNDPIEREQPMPESGYVYKRSRRGKTWETVVATFNGRIELVYTGRASIDGSECHTWKRVDDDGEGESYAATVVSCSRGNDAGAAFYVRVRRLEKRAEVIGKSLGIVVTTQRDPRGAAVKMWADHEDGRMLGCLS